MSLFSRFFGKQPPKEEGEASDASNAAPQTAAHQPQNPAAQPPVQHPHAQHPQTQKAPYPQTQAQHSGPPYAQPQPPPAQYPQAQYPQGQYAQAQISQPLSPAPSPPVAEAAPKRGNPPGSMTGGMLPPPPGAITSEEDASRVFLPEPAVEVAPRPSSPVQSAAPISGAPVSVDPRFAHWGGAAGGAPELAETVPPVRSYKVETPAAMPLAPPPAAQAPVKSSPDAAPSATRRRDTPTNFRAIDAIVSPDAAAAAPHPRLRPNDALPSIIVDIPEDSRPAIQQRQATQPLMKAPPPPPSSATSLGSQRQRAASPATASQQLRAAQQQTMPLGHMAPKIRPSGTADSPPPPGAVAARPEIQLSPHTVSNPDALSETQPASPEATARAEALVAAASTTSTTSTASTASTASTTSTTSTASTASTARPDVVATAAAQFATGMQKLGRGTLVGGMMAPPAERADSAVAGSLGAMSPHPPPPPATIRGASAPPARLPSVLPPPAPPVVIARVVSLGPDVMSATSAIAGRARDDRDDGDDEDDGDDGDDSAQDDTPTIVRADGNSAVSPEILAARAALEKREAPAITTMEPDADDPHATPEPATPPPMSPTPVSLRHGAGTPAMRGSLRTELQLQEYLPAALAEAAAQAAAVDRAERDEDAQRDRASQQHSVPPEPPDESDWPTATDMPDPAEWSAPNTKSSAPTRAQIDAMDEAPTNEHLDELAALPTPSAEPRIPPPPTGPTDMFPADDDDAITQARLEPPVAKPQALSRPPGPIIAKPPAYSTIRPAAPLPMPSATPFARQTAVPPAPSSSASAIAEASVARLVTKEVIDTRELIDAPPYSVASPTDLLGPPSDRESAPADSAPLPSSKAPPTQAGFSLTVRGDSDAEIPAARPSEKLWEHEAVDDVLREMEAGFGAIEGLQSMPPAGSPVFDDARALFTEIAATQMHHVRDFMMDLTLAPATADWLALCLPATDSLRQGAEQFEMGSLVEALSGFYEALKAASDSGAPTVEGAARERLITTYNALVVSLPNAFKLDKDRTMREGIIVRSLLNQLEDVRKVQLDRLFAAGLMSIEALGVAKPRDIVETTGLGLDLATRISERFRRYKSELSVLAQGDTRGEWKKLRELTALLHASHESFEGAAQKSDSKKKKESRRSRELALLDVKIMLARLGQPESLNTIERASFADKLVHLAALIEKSEPA